MKSCTLLWDFPSHGCLQSHQVSVKWEHSELAVFFTALHQLYKTVHRATLSGARSPVFHLVFIMTASKYTIFQGGGRGYVKSPVKIILPSAQGTASFGANCEDQAWVKLVGQHHLVCKQEPSSSRSGYLMFALQFSGHREQWWHKTQDSGKGQTYCFTSDSI